MFGILWHRTDIWMGLMQAGATNVDDPFPSLNCSLFNRKHFWLGVHQEYCACKQLITRNNHEERIDSDLNSQRERAEARERT